MALVPGWFGEAEGSAAARAREGRFLRRIARSFLTDIVISGAQPAGPGTLYVANHVSWLDIPLLAGLIDARFIAKADVRDWLLVGPAARRAGTLFVARDRRRDTATQAGTIAARLRGGDSLILFPEGTTSHGRALLPFRSSLFAAAADAARIQPLAICYRRAGGAPLRDQELEMVGWTGDEALLPNAARIARMDLGAEVRLLPTSAASEDPSRKAIADRCWAEIASAYAAMRGMAPKRSE